ncbi:RNA-directed DNA polymerase, eukaryota [Tanacetum coccineum]
MTWYFTQVRPITKSFTIDEKLVWLEITRLPLQAWTINAFKKIASVWGEPMFVDEDPNENMATGRVCIKTKVSGAISEVCSVVIQNITHHVHVKEFAGWYPDIDVASSVVSDTVKDLNSDNESDGNHSKHTQDEEEGEIKENDIDDGPALQNDPQHRDSIPLPNANSHSWADEVAMEDKLDDQVAKEDHLQHEASQHDENIQQSQTKTPPQPPGFEGFKVQSKRISLNKGNMSSKGHSSAFSFIDDKVTKEGKSKSSSKLRSNGSLIEAFISHIEMGNVLGYDMEGSKADLKKIIDSIGANDIHK